MMIQQFLSNRLHLLVLLSFASILLASCEKGETELSKEPATRPVKLLQLSLASEIQASRYPGVISSSEFAKLSFQVGGQLSQIAVDPGQKVAKGEVIARIDQKDFESRVASAFSTFQNAESQYQRVLRLSPSNAVSDSVVEARKKERDRAKSQLDIAEKALEDTVLRAPFTGYIAESPLRESQSVSAGQLVASITSANQPPEVTIDLPARVITDWQSVENASVTVTMAAIPELKTQATFKSAILIADKVTQTYAVTFTFEPKTDFIILPGMTATVELKRPEVPSPEVTKVSVPLTAVLSDGSDKYVWVVDDDTMVVSKRVVTITEGIGETVIVTEGLIGDETIAIAGAAYLGNGMKVHAWKGR